MPVTDYFTVDGMIIGEQTNGVNIDYIPDALGNVVAAVDQNLNTTYTAAYKPFGDVLASSGTKPNFTWVGTLGYLASAGVPYAEYSVRARIQSSKTGRWVSVDPLWPAEPAFIYALASPVLTVDPSGAACVTPGTIRGSSNQCPPGVKDGIRAAWAAFCKKYGGGLSSQQQDALASCAQGMMPGKCSSYVPPSLSGLGPCLKNWCKLDPSSVITCDANDPQCQKGNCADTLCIGGAAPSPIRPTNICPGAYDSDCSVAKGCRTGGGFYNIPPYTPPRGTPPWTQILVHELMHGCVTCGASKNLNCMESYTQALTACIIEGV